MKEGEDREFGSRPERTSGFLFLPSIGKSSFSSWPHSFTDPAPVTRDGFEGQLGSVEGSKPAEVQSS